MPLLLCILEEILDYYKAKTLENRKLTEDYLMKHRQINVHIPESGPNSCASFTRSSLLEAVDQVKRAVEQLMKQNLEKGKKKEKEIIASNR